MKKYVNLTATQHADIKLNRLNVGQVVTLQKDANNLYDTEAVKVILNNVGHVGYVANSINTVVSGCSSAGNIHDLVGNGLAGVVRFVTGCDTIIEINILEIDPATVGKESENF